MQPIRRIHKLSQAKRVCVNRVSELKKFEDLAFSTPAKTVAILVYHGIGGQGKTALCHELGRRLSNDPSYQDHRAALLDFHGQRTDDPVITLVRIRNAFAKTGIQFSVFDIALGIYWDGGRADRAFPTLTNPFLAKSKAAFDIVSPDLVKSGLELASDTVQSIPGVGPLLKKGSGWLFNQAKMEYLKANRHHLKELTKNGALLLPSEISQLLPWFLAQDLNYHLETHPKHRLILLVDECERLYEGSGVGARWQQATVDACLRVLFSETNKLFVVLFSREKLPWRNDPSWRSDLADSHVPLEELSRKDAEIWVAQLGVEQVAIRDAILNAATVESEQANSAVYPLLLELLVDHWQMLVANGVQVSPDDFALSTGPFEQRRKILIERILRDYDESVQAVIEVMAVPTKIHKDILISAVRDLGVAISDARLEQVLQLSFVNRLDDEAYSLHNVISQTLRNSISVSWREKIANSLLSRLVPLIEKRTEAGVDDLTMEYLLIAAHLRFTLGAEGYVDWLMQVAASEPFMASTYLMSLEGLWRDALEVASDEAQADVDSATFILAELLKRQGKYAEAKEVCSGLEARIDERYEVDDSRNLNVKHLMSEIFLLNGEYELSAQHARRNLRIWEQKLEPSNISVSVLRALLGHSLCLQGRIPEAERISKKNLQIAEEYFSDNVRHLAGCHNALAFVLNDQGKYGEAEQFNRKACELLEGFDLASDVDLSAMYNNLAHNLSKQGKIVASKELYWKAFECAERTLGEHHPDTLQSYSNYGVMLGHLGEHDEAEIINRAVLDAMLLTLGPEHPETANQFNNLGALLNKAGKFEIAQEACKRAVEIREKIYGRNHFMTAQSCNNWAFNADGHGEAELAEERYRISISIYENTVGLEHPEAIATLSNLTSNLERQGKA